MYRRVIIYPMKMGGKQRPIVAAIAAVLMALAVTKRGIWFHKSGSEPLPSYFVVVAGAQNVKHRHFNGQDELFYTIESEYPADAVLNPIKANLAELVWKPLAEDYLNPGIPSSNVRGWDYFVDESTHPRTSVRSWLAQWQNANGDVMIYSLEYRCKDDGCSVTGGLHKLKVRAIYVPAELAKRMKKFASENSPR